MLFKHDIVTEEYVRSLIPKGKRSLMAQLRCGVLPLSIETGRFKNIKDEVTGCFRRLKPEERTYEICNNNEIEDEFHFIMKCTKYSIPRRNLINILKGEFNEFGNIADDINKFIFILTSGWKYCVNYVFDAWMIRKRTLFKS